MSNAAKAHSSGRPARPARAMSEAEAIEVRQLVRDLNREDAAVVVEGKRDAAALAALGFDGTPMRFHAYGGFAKFADLAARHRRVIILFDYDRKGRYMTGRLIRLLQRRTALDMAYRRRLSKITGGRVRFVEELLRYRETEPHAGVPQDGTA